MKIYRKLLKITFWFFGILIVLVAGILLLFQLSVKPGVFVIRRLFDQRVTIVDKHAFTWASPKVGKKSDLIYASKYRNNQMDIYYPVWEQKAKGVLFWVHGGGFVAGDKGPVEEFATYVVADTGIAVVAVNYGTAPDLEYPGQIFQLDEAVDFFRTSHPDLISVDFSKIFFGGDSAGGQIAGQYTALLTNKDYAESFGFRPSVSSEALTGFISYCAPVDIQQLGTVSSDSRFEKFFANTVARAFLGTRNWKNHPKLKEASVAEFITTDFPPTFITDGNSFSFQEQGLIFEKKLEALEVSVESLFFNDTDREIPHEYQFDYKREEAKECLQKTIHFIDKQLEKQF